MKQFGDFEVMLETRQVIGVIGERERWEKTPIRILPAGRKAVEEEEEEEDSYLINPKENNDDDDNNDDYDNDDDEN